MSLYYFVFIYRSHMIPKLFFGQVLFLSSHLERTNLSQ